MTQRCVRLERPRCVTMSATLAAMAKPEPLAPGELTAQDPEPESFHPTRRDWSDLLVALSWLKPLMRRRGKRWLCGGGLVEVVRLRAQLNPWS